MRGDGSIYKRGQAFWIKYYAPDPATGKRKACRERGGDTEAEAKILLKKRRRQIIIHEEGLRKFHGPRQEKVTVNDILDSLVTDFEVRGLQSAKNVSQRLRHVRSFMGPDLAAAITPDVLNQYIKHRKREEAAPATINRELAALRQAFRLAAETGIIPTAPRFRLLKEKNARLGFFDRAEFYAVLKAIRDPDIEDFLEWFFFTGMRPKSIRALAWADLDAKARELRVHARDDKTGRGIVLPLSGEWRALIQRRVDRRRMDCPFIFQRNGRPINRFEKRWERACAEAGVSGKIPYDLRRTAARNMIRAGVPERVVMAIMGWTTRASIDRSNISSPDDKLRAQALLSEYLKGQAREPKIRPMRR